MYMYIHVVYAYMQLNLGNDSSIYQLLGQLTNQNNLFISFSAHSQIYTYMYQHN